MEIFLVGFCIQGTVHTVEKLSNRAHCEEYKVAVSAIFRNSRKWQSINEEFNATGREMKFRQIVTGGEVISRIQDDLTEYTNHSRMKQPQAIR